MPSTYNKEKPWDDPHIDKWKIDEFKPEDNAGGPLLDVSSFSLKFPKYRETYLRGVWSLVTKRFASLGISCTLDLVDGTMTVTTTLKTYDPYAIINCRDVLKLLARSVPAPEAFKMLEDGITSDIIPIRNLVRNKERFVKRRQRLLGPNGSTLKALQLLTDTYILVQGNTVSVIGPYKSMKVVRRAVEDTMANFHPIYTIKELMIRRELAADPNLKDQDWSRFLPDFRKRTMSKRRIPHRTNDKSKKVYTPFPPPQEKSKVDLQIESGEYFLNERRKTEKRQDEWKRRQRGIPD